MFKRLATVLTPPVKPKMVRPQHRSSRKGTRVTRKKLPKNDLTRKMMDFDTVTKIALEC